MAAEMERVEPTDPRAHAYAFGVELAAQFAEEADQVRELRTHTKRRIVHIISMEERVVTEEEIFTTEQVFNNTRGNYS
ncbi:hypothetical protein [Streptomyces sp. NPDC048669]|uniref:hypothetical protein n=1 Tax=Streptomyces sp. NPDC048669 TaxID=3155267 RepID=UPI003449CDDE